MFRRKLKIIFLFYGLCTSLLGYAQTPVGSVKPDAKMTPGTGAEGGGLSSLYSPSLFDGTANISIPIYQYSNDGGNYGVNFTYNTKGILVNDWAGPAGLNWKIPLGSITRTVKDLPDEINVIAWDDSVNVPNPIGQSGNINYKNRFMRFRGKFAAYGQTPQQAADTTTYRDEEADEYNVNVGKLAFSFRLGSNGTIFTHPQRNVSVQLTLDGVVTSSITSQLVGVSTTSQVPGFIITDEEGNKYYFVRGDYGKREITDDYWGQTPMSGYSLISKWDIQKIVLASGSVIRYTYKQQTYPPAFATYQSYGLVEYGSAAFLGGPVHGDDYYSSVESITYPNGVIANFIYDNAPRCDLAGSFALREIRISSGGNCLRYRLDQSYFIAENGSGIKEQPYGSCLAIGGDQSNLYHRLKLNGITLMSCDGNQTEPYYSFTYDNTSLPRRLFGGQDWFGYYNGNIPLQFVTGSPTDSSLSVPLHKCFNANGPWVNKDIGVDKTENPAKARAGILTSISNAYGGSVSFSYSGHATLSNMLGGLPISDVYYYGLNANDGLLLTGITETDSYHPENTRTTTFDYQNGQYFLNGGYFHYPRSMEDGTNTPASIIMTGMYNSPHQMVNGANHGYSNVTVTTRANPGGMLLSKKEITFSNFSDPTSGNQPRLAPLNGSTDFYQFPYTDKTYIRDWEMALPLSITEYDQNNRIVQQTKNFYHSTLVTYAPNADVHKVLVIRKDQSPENGLGYYAKRKITDPYTPCTAKSLLDSTIVYKYVSDNTFITDTLKYRYDGRNNLKAILTRNSKGEEIRTIQYYNYELTFDLGGGASISPLSGLEKLVGTQRWKRIPGTTGDLPANGMLLDGYFNGIVMEGNLATNPRLRSKNLYNLVTAKPLTYSQYLGTGSYTTTDAKVQAVFNSAELPGFKKTSEVLLIDAQNNPLETQVNEQYKAMIWDTATGQKLAEAGSCHYSDIAYSSFETGSYNTNLDYNPAQLGILSNGGVSGGKCFALWNAFSQTANYLNSTQNLQAGKEYILSFWVSGNNPVVTAGGAVQTLPATATYTKGNWKNYQIRFTPGAAGTKVTFNGTAANSLLDEVRLCPSSALMQSWTYAPLWGISSQTDATGRITTYEYDQLGRQTLVRDQEGNILSKTQFTVNGPE